MTRADLLGDFRRVVAAGHVSESRSAFAIDADVIDDAVLRLRIHSGGTLSSDTALRMRQATLWSAQELSPLTPSAPTMSLQVLRAIPAQITACTTGLRDDIRV